MVFSQTSLQGLQNALEKTTGKMIENKEKSSVN